MERVISPKCERLSAVFAEGRRIIQNHALQRCVERRQSSDVSKLLRDGADPNFIIEGKSALHLACEVDDGDEDEDIIGALVDHGADLGIEVVIAHRARNRRQIVGSPLLHAVMRGLVSTVRKMLDRGVLVDAEDERGETALLWATSQYVPSNGDEIAQILLDARANPNVTGLIGMTPLKYAVKHRRIGVIKKLLEKGADPDDRGSIKPSLTMLWQNESDRDGDIVDLLLMHGATPLTQEHRNRLQELTARTSFAFRFTVTVTIA